MPENSHYLFPSFIILKFNIMFSISACVCVCKYIMIGLFPASV